MTARIPRLSTAYRKIVETESVTLTEPLVKKQLLILDLNGTLVSRVRRNKSMYTRPYIQPFLDYTFENFVIMVWSSAQPHSVGNMIRLFGEQKENISTLWDRTSLNLAKSDYNRKCVTIKDLEKVWQHYEGIYDAKNTILLDDSGEKTILQPHNAIHPVEFEHTSKEFILNGDNELLTIIQYLKRCQHETNIPNFISENPYKHENIADVKSWECLFYKFADPLETTPEKVDFQERNSITSKPKNNSDDEELDTVTESLNKLEVSGRENTDCSLKK